MNTLSFEIFVGFRLFHIHQHGMSHLLCIDALRRMEFHHTATLLSDILMSLSIVVTLSSFQRLSTIIAISLTAT